MIRHDEMTEIIPVDGAQHMARLPSALVWKSQDIANISDGPGEVVSPNQSSLSAQPLLEHPRLLTHP